MLSIGKILSKTMKQKSLFKNILPDLTRSSIVKKIFLNLEFMDFNF